jgi:DNA (cytosine-5)-methyltransferase 1
VLDAQHFGVPQRRRRVVIVGHLGAPWGAPAEVLLEPAGVSWDSAPLRESLLARLARRVQRGY